MLGATATLTLLDFDSRQSPQITENFENKIDHISKNKNLKINFSYVSDHCASFGTRHFLAIFGNFFAVYLPKFFNTKSIRSQKTKNRKNHRKKIHRFQNIWKKTQFGHFWGGTGEVLHVVNWDKARIPFNLKGISKSTYLRGT